MTEAQARAASRDIGRHYTFKATQYRKRHPDFAEPPKFDVHAELANIMLAFSCKLSNTKAVANRKLDNVTSAIKRELAANAPLT
jgi:hypothetical protein